jgi:hypothetical protein
MSEKNLWTTEEVARLLEVSYQRLYSLMRDRLMDPPSIRLARIYLWSADDINRAREALKKRRPLGRPIAPRSPARPYVTGGRVKHGT